MNPYKNLFLGGYTFKAMLTLVPNWKNKEFQMYEEIVKDTANFMSTYMKVLYSQMMLETGKQTSNYYINHNNMFGMKKSSRTQYVSGYFKGESGDMAEEYEHPAFSLASRIDWDLKSFRVKPPVDDGDIQRYMREVLSKGYAEDKDYLSSWLNLHKALWEDALYNIPIKPAKVSNLRNVTYSADYPLLFIASQFDNGNFENSKDENIAQEVGFSGVEVDENGNLVDDSPTTIKDKINEVLFGGSVKKIIWLVLIVVAGYLIYKKFLKK